MMATKIWPEFRSHAKPMSWTAANDYKPSVTTIQCIHAFYFSHGTSPLWNFFKESLRLEINSKIIWFNCPATTNNTHWTMYLSITFVLFLNTPRDSDSTSSLGKKRTGNGLQRSLRVSRGTCGSPEAPTASTARCGLTQRLVLLGAIQSKHGHSRGKAAAACACLLFNKFFFCLR